MLNIVFKTPSKPLLRILKCTSDTWEYTPRMRITNLEYPLISACTTHLWLPTPGSHWDATDLISRNANSSVKNTLIPSTYCPIFPMLHHRKAYICMYGVYCKTPLKSMKDRWNKYGKFWLFLQMGDEYLGFIRLSFLLFVYVWKFA